MLRSLFVTVVLGGSLVGSVRAQDRMPPIPADKLTDAQKKASEAFAEGRGYEVRGPFVPLLRSPEVMLRAKAMGDYLRFKSTLPPRLSEMVILITAREWTQNYEWHAHHPLALKAGLRPEIADAIAQGYRPAGMTDDEEIAYDTATEILREKRVSDRTYARAVAKFGEQGVIDLLGIVGYYNFLAIVMNATRAAMPPGAAEPLKRYPD
jgi:4-carboxymuconolactone decarboxylase